MQRDSHININDNLYELSLSQAREVLQTFLREERSAFNSVEIGEITLDYSPLSVVEALKYVAAELKAGLLSKEEQNLWFTRLGYYFGEALRQAKPNLAWGLGSQDYAFANHPVIIGFFGDEEAPVITICRNMIEAVAEGLSPASRIDNGVKNWFEKKESDKAR